MIAEGDVVRLRVSVPATAANLGPGFDCAGVALDLRDTYRADVEAGSGAATSDPDVTVSIHGEGADGSIATDATNLVVQAMLAGLTAWQVPVPTAVRLSCHNVIPHSRGLGSSSAAIVGGMALARALAAPGSVTDADVLALATDLEGHPDNVAAAVYGGFTISWQAADRTGHALALSPTRALTPILAIPAESLSTARARGLVPAEVETSVAVFNLSRSALLAAALTTSPAHIFTATEDQLHQNQRAAAYPRSHALMCAMRAEGHAAAISGAGPTVIAFAPTNQARQTAAQMAALAGAGWEVQVRDFSTAGVRTETVKG